MMSSTETAHNDIQDRNVTPVAMGRSASSARFQIAKVSNSEHRQEASLGKAVSIPSGK